jgi:hypothetical protein
LQVPIRRDGVLKCFFKFLKQELDLSYFISKDLNGIKTVWYLTLILAILLTVYKKENKLKDYKIPKLKFSQEIEYNETDNKNVWMGSFKNTLNWSYEH